MEVSPDQPGVERRSFPEGGYFPARLKHHAAGCLNVIDARLPKRLVDVASIHGMAAQSRVVQTTSARVLLQMAERPQWVKTQAG